MDKVGKKNLQEIKKRERGKEKKFSTRPHNVRKTKPSRD